MKRVVMLPYAFVLMNWAAMAGLYHFIRRQDDTHKTIWTKSSPHSRCDHQSA